MFSHVCERIVVISLVLIVIINDVDVYGYYLVIISPKMASTGGEKTPADGKLVLFVGWTCVDVINIVDRFPQEDADSRILDYYWQRGGNANNSSTVLSVLGTPCELLSVIPRKCREFEFLMSDIKKYGIKTDHCVFIDKDKCPLSTAILSKSSGTRTILHTLRDIPNISCTDFLPICENLHQYSWIHFEGRPNIDEICRNLEEIDRQRKQGREITMTSVELEHPYIGEKLDLLLDKADYVFLSKDYAKDRGFMDKEGAVKTLSSRIREGATLVCAWGEDGAAAIVKGGELISVPAIDLVDPVDSLGAGDTFIGSFIHASLHNCSLEECLNYACLVAGNKCCIRGYEGLSKFTKT